MKIFTTLLLAIIAHFSVAQISFLKELNTQEEGSSPANFTEVNSITFFSVKTIDGYNLWKTDGTEAGTVVVSTQPIDIHITGYGVPNFQVLNNELYYYVQKPKTAYSQPLELWKTDGTNNTLIASEISIVLLYYINNTICYQSHQGLFKIEGGISIKIKDFGTSYIYINEPPVLFNNQLIFYTGQFPRSGENILQIWKTDGTESGTTIISNIDRLLVFNSGIYDHQKVSLKIDNQVYFVVKRISVDRYKVNVELWKTNGIETVFIKEISNYDSYTDDNTYNIASKLANFNGKLLFNFYNDIWMSDGTPMGTNKIKTLSTLGANIYENVYGKWGVLNDKFYFAGMNGDNYGDFELWQSDGTTAGTILLKDIKPTSSSAPNYFTTINNKLYFKTSNDEIWQTDGTVNGTLFIQNITKPANSLSTYRAEPQFIYTSNNYLLYGYYDEQHGFELWKTSGITQSLLKNITTYNQTSLGSNKKVKVGNSWYFNGMDYRGAELWKSDGTPEGTVLVKDLNTGIFSTVIQEIVAVGNIVYFTARFTNENFNRIFRSDGSENGTVEMTPQIINPNFLTASTNNLFFMGSYLSSNMPWISNNNETRPISTSYIYYITPSNLIGVGNKLFFTSNGLWVSDGVRENTFRVCGDETINVPINPICLIEFKGKVYFFSNYYDSQFTTHYGLFESDGTRIGTKIVKEFNQNLISNYLIFIEKSADRIYFRANFAHGQSFDLWASDGTTNGTEFIKTIPALTNSSQVGIGLKFYAVGNKFYIFINQQYYSINNILWTSDGTSGGTFQIFEKQNSPTVTSIIDFKCKLYFNLFDSNYGQELWESDGTIAGTHLTGEVITGTGNSHVENLMSFDNKLVFWANNATSGTGMWQYLPPSNLSIKNQSIESGTWDSSSTWSCGRIPTRDDIITIKTGHTITIPDNYQTNIKGISTENGAVLKIPQSAVFTVNPR